MTIQNANAIVQRLGPCRIALDQTTHGDLARELALMGCDLADIPAPGAKTAPGATVGLLDWTSTSDSGGFATALRPFRQMEALAVLTAGQDRRPIERALFDAGWQRHPGGMMVGEYPAWSAQVLPPLSFYQRTRQSGAQFLQKGVDGDPLIARYAMAANHVRPSDHVLIDGAGSADGAAILLALSRAGSIVRVSAKPKQSFKGGRAIETVTPDLAALDDHSIDLIIAIEPATPGDWIARLDDYSRILKHDGRIVLGWRRSAGDNARPRDWAMLSDEVAQRFLPETRYVQIPVGADPAGAHALFPIALDNPAATEWMMIVAAANPLMGADQAEGYNHPAFPTTDGPMPALVDFGAAYDNPWLYRSMVQMGERLADDVKLARLAECVIEDSREESADRGAAIAVLGYRVLEMRRGDLAEAVLPLIAAYIDRPLTDDVPVHVRRWRISLAFLAGRLNELAGHRDDAKRRYRAAAEGSWEAFSPLLATKAIAAAFYEARMHLADGDSRTALGCFRQGVDTATRATAFPHQEQMGANGEPLPFYFQELAEVIDMGSQCANALAHFPLWERDPGLFWRQVDIRRFGLASWARDLERENERLRAA